MVAFIGKLLAFDRNSNYRACQRLSKEKGSLCSWKILKVILLCSCFVHLNCGQTVTFSIGAVLDSGENLAKFLMGRTVPVTSNPIRTAQDVCDNLITSPVYAVIVSTPKQEPSISASISFTCGFFNVPVIGIANRDSSLSNKDLHGTYMRTVPPYSHQADLWIEILKELKYQGVIFITSSDTNGQNTLHRFQNMGGSSVKIEYVIEYVSGLPNVTAQLNHAKNNLTFRVYILYADQEDAEQILEEAKQLDMIGPGYAWLVSEQALSARNRVNGLIGPVLKNAHDEAAHIKDSVNIIVMALRDLYLGYGNMTEPPNDCTSNERWETGIKLMQYLRNQTLSNGATGRVSFDDNYDRLESDYSIINIQDGRLVEVGNYTYSINHSSMKLNLNLNDIVWPGGTQIKPSAFYVNTHLRIATIAEEPFIWADLPPESGICDSGHVKCTYNDIENGTETTYCCRGYCIDLLVKLSDEVGFTYDLYFVFDRFFGIYYYQNNTKTWDGLVGELVNKKADMVLAPLTINPQRAKVIDFSKPFKYQGITMLQKKMPKGAKLDSFLQPFQHNLWLLVMLSVHVVAVVLYLLDRFSPLGRFGHPKPDHELPHDEKALNISSAVLFAWGVLLNSGIGEKAPKSFSARVLGMVWAGFAMIVVASYTANLAAFLVLDQAETEITGLDDARLRNPVEGFTYATVKHSSVDEYFRDQVELSNMYRLMEDLNRETAAEAIQAVREGKLNVFFWDSPRLEYEAANDCDLIISGETFGRSGYGVGLQKNSFWTENVTLSILNMHESGYMEKLDNQWILKGDRECEKETENFPTTLGLKNMAGVFILVGMGILAGFVFIVIEIFYKRRKARRIKQITLARRAGRKWLAIVRSRKVLKCPPPTSIISKTTKVSATGLNSSGISTVTKLLSTNSLGRSTTPPPLPFKRTSQHPNIDRSRGDFQKGNFRLNTPPYTIERGMNEMIAHRSSLTPTPPIGSQILTGPGSESPLGFKQFQHSQPMGCYGYDWNKMGPRPAGLPQINVAQNFIGHLDPDIPPPPPPPPMTSPRVKPTNSTPYIRGGKGYFAV